ncbi:MAG: glutamyl-tRNA reductase [Planctomycetota bacterium]
MERIGVVGFSLHRSSVAELEHAKLRLARLDDAPLLACADLLGASEAVLLSTCNRCELWFVRESGAAPGERDRERLSQALELAPELAGQILLHSGRAALRHLLRVVASLDSLVLGEDQILAQVRSAAAEARARGLAGRLLGPLFEEALHFGKSVRATTDLAHHPVSVVSLAVQFLAERLAGVDGPCVAVLGAGATGAHAARALAAAGLGPQWIANRTRARAEALAEAVGARACTLDELCAVQGLDALVSATSASQPVLTAAALAALAARAPSGRLVTVDLAVPRDLEPCDDARHEGIDLESLRARAEANRALRAASARVVEERLERELERILGQRAAGTLTAPYADLMAEVREAFELELTALAAGPLAHLCESDRRRVERWARHTFGRLAHRPFRALKQLGRAGALPEIDWEGLE